MLRELHIQNLAIVDDIRVEFGTGLNIISGETGAGKSIVIDSISLILGSRSDNDMIRSGYEQGVVEATFDIQDNADIIQRLENHGIDYDPHELLVVKRILSRAGKNKVYVNGQLANLSILQELTSGLVDISSQHEHHRLINQSGHVRIIDAYGGLVPLRLEYQQKLKQMHEILVKIKELSMNETERARHLDFLAFQINEIKQVAPQADEEATLEKDRKRLSSAQERLAFLEEARHSLSENEPSLIGQLSQLLDRCTDITAIDESFDPLRRGFESAMIQLEETLHEMTRLEKNLDCDPSKLEEINERLSALRSLLRKYGPSVNDVLNFQAQSEAQLIDLQEREARLESLQAELEGVREEAMSLGLSLSQKRKKITEVFTSSVEAELTELGFDQAKLHTVFEPLEPKRRFGADGIDRMHFQVSMNPGEPPHSLSKTASGGELSRLLLAMKNVIAGKGEISVYLFDEVDSGIGGRVALQVGQKLASVAQHNQVICITHLPQVACFADRHFQVAKSHQSGRTITTIRSLEPDDQTHEIIRMIGGEELGDSALRHAEDLLRTAQQRRLELRRLELT